MDTWVVYNFFQINLRSSPCPDYQEVPYLPLEALCYCPKMVRNLSNCLKPKGWILLKSQKSLWLPLLCDSYILLLLKTCSLWFFVSLFPDTVVPQEDSWSSECEPKSWNLQCEPGPLLIPCRLPLIIEAIPAAGQRDKDFLSTGPPAQRMLIHINRSLAVATDPCGVGMLPL